MKIETVSGALVDPVNPDPKSINIKDIAWSLSRLPRFAGHTISIIPYTVGQHSIFVSDMIFEKTNDHLHALYGLLHDATESYIGDIPSPIKQIPELREAIKKVEHNLFLTILKSFDIMEPSEEAWKLVKEFDKRSQIIEAFTWMPSRGKHWEGRERLDIDFIELQQFPEPQESVKVYKEFLEKFNYHYIRDSSKG